jgi:CHAD domain-containing protein
MDADSGTKRDRRAMKASGKRRAGMARAASRAWLPLVRDAERLLERFSAGRGGENRVHRLRGALRKLEILIGCVGCGFDDAPVERFRKAVRRARKSAGAVRDMDVAIGLVRQVCAGADTIAAGDGVVGILQSRRDRALKQLGALGTRSRGAIAEACRATLNVPVPSRAALPARCAATLALARAGEAMREAVAAGLGTPELLHELRLNLKDARTVLEALGEDFGTAADGLAERARALSDLLGEVNDYATLADLLGALAPKAGQKREASVRAVMDLVRVAHAKGHDRAVRRAQREVPTLVRDIRAVIFNAEAPFATER